MSTPTEPIREEHRHLQPHIGELRSTAEAVRTRPVSEVRSLVERAHGFLVEHLIPHADAEDRALYPAVGRAMGAPEATRTMTRDHAEVGALTEELGRLLSRIADPLPEEVATDLQRILFGLHALVTLHFAKEEEIYLPILDERLEAEEVERVVREMHGG
jgi:hemerythrin-like domain-containing protein